MNDDRQAVGPGPVEVLVDQLTRLNGLGDRLRGRLNGFAAERGIEFCATGYGSLVGIHFTRGPVRNEAARRGYIECSAMRLPSLSSTSARKRPTGTASWARTTWSTCL